jgi:mannose-6-phosphate isomerase-like protein (cupin superfamily)
MNRFDIIQKGWGYEKIIVNEKDYCGKVLYFLKDEKTSMHYHINKHETFYVLSGEFDIKIIYTKDASHVKHHLTAGMKLPISQNTPHQIIALTCGEIIEFSSHDDPMDSYRIEEGSSQTKNKKVSSYKFENN